jgi:hypothetical protein
MVRVEEDLRGERVHAQIELVRRRRDVQPLQARDR